MTMLEHLTAHARENIWRSPAHDRQNVIRPAKISRRRGSINTQRIMWETIPLPDGDNYYHVYQIGAIKPSLIGLLGTDVSWQNLGEIINRSPLLARIYVRETARKIPEMDSYFRWDRHGNLILAIRDRREFSEIRDVDIEIHVYSNSYFYSPDSHHLETYTYYQGKRVESVEQLAQFRQQMQIYRNKEGAVFCYKNGYFVSSFPTNQTDIYDIVEFIYDGSVKQVLDFPINQLPTFVSTLDGNTKYFLHNADRDMDDYAIDFADDCDIFLVEKNENDYYWGNYCSKATSEILRNITHRDYSSPVDLLLAYYQTNSDRYSGMDNLYIRLYTRHTGIPRDLIYEDNRIFELYRLPEEQTPRAMVSTDATLRFWQADVLESSPYLEIMSNKNNNLPSEKVEDAYGYNAISRILGDTPVKTFRQAGWPSVILKPAQRYESCAYEFDEDGLLLGFYNITNMRSYACRNPNTYYVEVVTGHARRDLDITYDQFTVDTNPSFNYRAYLAARDPQTGYALNNTWDDVSNSDIIEVGNNQINFDVGNDYVPATLSDKSFLGYSFNLRPNNGLFTFEITADIDFGDGAGGVAARPAIPPGRVDIWFNGRYQIEGVDYIVNWPRIVISNFRHTQDQTDENEVVIRAMGFCDENMEMTQAIDYGFIKNGYIGDTERYRIREDMVYSLVIDGKLVHRDDAQMGEHNEGVIVPGFNNGLPYEVKETIVPIRDQFYHDTYQMRSLARERDKEIAQYFTEHYEPFKQEESFSIPELYATYSPFVGRLIFLLNARRFSDNELFAATSVDDIRDLLKDHTWILDYDPAYWGVNENFISVRVHPYNETISLNTAQYNFVRRVINVLLKSPIEISGFIEIEIDTNLEEE